MNMNHLWLPVLLLSMLVTSACSLSTEDTRITFCRELTLSMVEDSDSLVWLADRQHFQPSEYAAVILEFETASEKTGTAVCYYAYDAPEDNAITLSTPLTAHASVPYRMELNGDPVSQARFREVVIVLQSNILLRFLDGLFKDTDNPPDRTGT